MILPSLPTAFSTSEPSRTTGGTVGCDSVYEYPGDTLVYDLADAFPSSNTSGNDACHAGAIGYNAAEDTITVALRTLNAIVAIASNGSLKWVLGSADGTLDTGGVTWQVQYGMHLLDATTLAFFNNQTSASSFGRLVTLDHGAQTATFSLAYSMPVSQIYGDAQFLPNGNLLFTASTVGSGYEVTRTGSLVRTITFPGPVSLANYRTSLYGPPPR
jgi:hypothetical protein